MTRAEYVAKHGVEAGGPLAKAFRCELSEVPE